MYQRILTKREKMELEKYLKTEQSSGFINTLRYRTVKYLPTIKEEVAMLERLLSEI